MNKGNINDVNKYLIHSIKTKIVNYTHLIIKKGCFQEIEKLNR